jgi:hypothetical protein
MARIRQLVALDIIIFILISVFVVAAIFNYYDRPGITFSYSYKFANNGTLIDLNRNTTSEATAIWKIALNFTTLDVISAQTAINVSAIARVLDDNPHEGVQIIFPTALPISNPQYNDGHAAPATIDLQKSTTDAKLFTGSTELTYRDEGDKCVFVREIALIVQEEFPLCPEGAQPVIHISSADSKFQFETNKVTISLAYLAAGLTFVAFRQMISGFGKRWAVSS